MRFQIRIISYMQFRDTDLNFVCFCIGLKPPPFRRGTFY